MHDTSDSAALLLLLYRSARETTTREFQHRAMSLLEPVLKFDSAIWGNGTTDGNSIAAEAAHLHRVDPRALSEWKSINGKDKGTAIGLHNTGRAIHLHIPTLYAESHDSEYRAYAAKWKRKDFLGMAVAEPAPRSLQWVSLFRHHDALYSERERLICESLMPHLAEALRINRALTRPDGGHRPAAAIDGQPMALAEAGGRLRFVQPAFLALIRREWQQVDDSGLPRPLAAALGVKRNGVFSGRFIKVRVSRSGDLFLLEAALKTALDDLPPQRARIARLFAQGCSHKLIAQRLQVAPSTVRNQIAAAYRELGVSSRNELIALGQGAADDSSPCAARNAFHRSGPSIPRGGEGK